MCPRKGIYSLEGSRISCLTEERSGSQQVEQLLSHVNHPCRVIIIIIVNIVIIILIIITIPLNHNVHDWRISNKSLAPTALLS